MSKKSLTAKYLEDVAKVITSNKTAEEKARAIYAQGRKFSIEVCEKWAARFAAEVASTVVVWELELSPEKASAIAIEEFTKNRK